MKNHKTMHNRDKVYPCEYCGMTLKTEVWVNLVIDKDIYMGFSEWKGNFKQFVLINTLWI